MWFFSMDGNLTGVIILLVIYALISAADTALGALNDIRLDDMKSEGKKGVKLLKNKSRKSDNDLLN
jgi:Mg2+/Co2+ transporter CorB